jgi:hypothetical protein
LCWIFTVLERSPVYRSNGRRFGGAEGRGSIRSDECRGGVERRQTEELKGVAGGD